MQYMRHNYILFRPTILATAFALAMSCVHSRSADAAFQLDRLVDSSTAFPGGGAFQYVHAGATGSGAVYTFSGLNTFGDRYICIDNGSIICPVGPNTPVPGGVGNFELLGAGANFDGTDFVFREHSNGANGPAGIYASRNGAIERIVDRTMAFPGGVGNFNELSHAPYIDNGTISFSASDAALRRGLFTHSGGVLTRQLYFGDPAPEGGTFDWLVDLSYEDGSFAFTASSTASGLGIYKSVGGSLSHLVKTGDPAPNGGGAFQAFSSRPMIDGDDVAFLATTTTTDGAYIARNGQIETVIDLSAVLPGGGPLGVIQNFAFDDGVVYLNTLELGGELGVYVWDDGALEKIVRTGDFLDGVEVASVGFTFDAVENGRLIFDVDFTDNASALYSLTVPEPASATVLMLAFVLIGRRHRRGNHRGS